MSCGNYQVRRSRPQPPAQVKQMAPMQEQMDPRLVDRAARELQMRHQQPMSAEDGVNITISVNDQPVVGIGVQPASEQQAQQFSRTPLGRQLSSSMQIAPGPEAGEYVKKRSADILSEVLANATDPNLYGGGYYDIGKMYRPQ